MAGAELTARELDVLQQLAKGKSNQQIAAGLTMSEGTVKFHINHLLQKLGAADRTQAVLTALKRGFASLD
jgi:DNA-binding NarL/FixJ family response regulator